MKPRLPGYHRRFVDFLSFMVRPGNDTDIFRFQSSPNRIPLVNTPAAPSTRIGVKRIVIEVNRDLSVEQLEILDDALKQVGLVKTTKVTFHHARAPRRSRAAKPAHQPTHPIFRIG